MFNMYTYEKMKKEEEKKNKEELKLKKYEKRRKSIYNILII